MSLIIYEPHAVRQPECCGGVLRWAVCVAESLCWFAASFSCCSVCTHFWIVFKSAMLFQYLSNCSGVDLYCMVSLFSVCTHWHTNRHFTPYSNCTHGCTMRRSVQLVGRTIICLFVRTDQFALIMVVWLNTLLCVRITRWQCIIQCDSQFIGQAGRLAQSYALTNAHMRICYTHKHNTNKHTEFPDTRC